MGNPYKSSHKPYGKAIESFPRRSTPVFQLFCKKILPFSFCRPRCVGLQAYAWRLLSALQTYANYRCT